MAPFPGFAQVTALPHFTGADDNQKPGRFRFASPIRCPYAKSTGFALFVNALTVPVAGR